MGFILFFILSVQTLLRVYMIYMFDVLQSEKQVEWLYWVVKTQQWI